MPMHVKDAGAWKPVSVTWVRVAGVWRSATPWVKVGGVWKKASVDFFVYTGGASNAMFGGGFAAVTYEADGDIVVTEGFTQNGAGVWVNPAGLAPGSYQIRASHVSGDLPNSGDVLDTDLALTSARTWAMTQSGVGVRSGTILVELKDGVGNVVASGNCPLTAQGL